MGAFFSFLKWLFTDPVPNRGAPALYFSDVPTFTVRKRYSPYSDLEEKLSEIDGTGERETELVSMRRFFTTRCPGFLRPYRPTWWLPNGHFQTIWCSLGDFSTVDPVHYSRTFLSVPDGGTIGLDWTEPPSTSPEKNLLPDNTPILVVLHGLTGGSYESYVRAVLAKTCGRVDEGGLGYRGVVMNFRGCAGVKLTSPQMFSGGYTDDIRTSLLYIQTLYPRAPLIGLGFSLGANVLTRYVGEEGEQCRLIAACVMACPWDNLKNSDKLENRFINRTIYSKAMGGTLLQLFNRNSAELSSFPEPSAITPHLPILLSLKSPDFKTVNSHLTSIIGGSFPPFPFPTVEDYYIWSSAHTSLAGVKVPFLAINAQDDPIVAEIPLQEAGKNPWVGMCVTKNGGHLGWFEGGGFLGKGGPPNKWNVHPLVEWCYAIVEDFIDSRLDEGKKLKETYNDGEWEREKGSSQFVGYKVIAVGGVVPSSQLTDQTWAGL